MARKVRRDRDITAPPGKALARVIHDILTAASLGAVGTAAANAQSLPPECSPADPAVGDTVQCIADPPATIGGIETDVNQLTINVGTESKATIVDNPSGDGANMRGAGPLNLNLLNADSRISGSEDGVDITIAGGNGPVNVISNGTITGGDTGIRVTNERVGRLNVTVGEGGRVTGGVDGIRVQHEQSSDITITTGGDIVGTSGNGIYARGYGNISIQGIGGAGSIIGGGGFGVRARSDTFFVGEIAIGTESPLGDIRAATTGISAFNYYGSIRVVTEGDISAESGWGINAAGNGGVDISSSSNITAYESAIRGSGNEFGAVRITSTGNLVSETGRGISASAGAADLLGGVIDIASSGDIDAATTGIRAFSFGTNDILISHSGRITAGEDGIDAYLGSFGGGIRITSAGDVVAEAGDGIRAELVGDGDVEIVASGDVDAGDTGIRVITDAGADAISVTTEGNVTGATGGIDVEAGLADLSLTIGGDVTGGDVGIRTSTENGTQLTIDTPYTIRGGSAAILTEGDAANDAVVVLGTVVGDVLTMGGDDTVTLETGATLDGVVFLGDGDDQITISTSAPDGLHGGAGTDAATFLDGGGELAGTVTSGFETFAFEGGGFALTGLHEGLNTVDFNAGDHSLAGTLLADDVGIGASAGLALGDGSLVGADVISAGTLRLEPEIYSQVTVDGQFTQTADGALLLDTFSTSTADRLTVSGDVSLDGRLAVNQLGSMLDVVTLIDGQSELIGEFAEVDGLFSNGLLVRQSIEYDRANADVNLVVELDEYDNITGLTAKQDRAGSALFDDFMAEASTAAYRDLAYRIGGLETVDALGQALEQLHPDVLIAGIETVQNTQTSFVDRLLDLQRHAGQEGGTPSPAGPSFWSSAGYGESELDDDDEQAAYDSDGYTFSAGLSDIRLGRNTRGGLALHYARQESETGEPGADETTSEFTALAGHLSTGFDIGDLGWQLDAAVSVAMGDQETAMDVFIPDMGLSIAQSGRAAFTHSSGALRLTLTGSATSPWLLQPHVLIAGDLYRQEAMRIGATSGAALAVGDVDTDRLTVGYGVTLDYGWTPASRLVVGAGALHHGGETASVVNSRFANAANPAASSFTTTGHDIETQYLFDASFEHEFDGGWAVSLRGEASFGDVERVGAELGLRRRF